MSVRLFVLSALTAASAIPAGLVAQERQPVPRARVFINEGGPEVVRGRLRAMTQRRARLGVAVDMRASENDSIGATLLSVTPGGPGAKAGLRSGDIVIRLDGKSLVANDNLKAGEDESLPGVRLAEFAAQLNPDDTVSVLYRRGTVRATTTLVTGDEPITILEGLDPGGEFRFSAPGSMSWEGPGFEGRLFTERFPGGGGTISAFGFGGPLADLELAPLNPDLGQYFGATEGVLVISLPKESTLGLKSGDVILNIDGRKATSPGGLLRILRSYEPGDSFKFEIMRHKARTTVTGKLEERKRDE